jgi:hypothetical protein
VKRNTSRDFPAPPQPEAAALRFQLRWQVYLLILWIAQNEAVLRRPLESEDGDFIRR